MDGGRRDKGCNELAVPLFWLAHAKPVEAATTMHLDADLTSTTMQRSDSAVGLFNLTSTTMQRSDYAEILLHSHLEGGYAGGSPLLDAVRGTLPIPFFLDQIVRDIHTSCAWHIHTSYMGMGNACSTHDIHSVSAHTMRRGGYATWDIVLGYAAACIRVSYYSYSRDCLSRFSAVRPGLRVGRRWWVCGSTHATTRPTTASARPVCGSTHPSHHPAHHCMRSPQVCGSTHPPRHCMRSPRLRTHPTTLRPRTACARPAFAPTKKNFSGKKRVRRIDSARDVASRGDFRRAKKREHHINSCDFGKVQRGGLVFWSLKHIRVSDYSYSRDSSDSPRSDPVFALGAGGGRKLRFRRRGLRDLRGCCGRRPRPRGPPVQHG